MKPVARGLRWVPVVNRALVTLALAVATIGPWAAIDPPKPNASKDLLAAVKCGDDPGVRSSLKSGADPNARDAEGMTPLLCAAYRGNATAAVILIEAGADVNGKDSLGMTPLHAAAFEGRLEVIRVLLSRGASKAEQDKWGHGPLFYALQNHHPEAATLLQQGLPAKPPEPPPKATRIYNDETLRYGGTTTGSGAQEDPCCPQVDSVRQQPAYNSSATLSQVQAEQRIGILRERVRQLTLDRDAMTDRLAQLYRQCEESQRAAYTSTPTVVDPNDPGNSINSSGYPGRSSTSACSAYYSAQSQAGHIQEDINRYQSEIYSLQSSAGH